VYKERMRERREERERESAGKKKAYRENERPTLM